MVHASNEQSSTGITPSNSNLSNSNSFKSDEVKLVAATNQSRQANRSGKTSARRSAAKQKQQSSNNSRRHSDGGETESDEEVDEDETEYASLPQPPDASTNPFVSVSPKKHAPQSQQQRTLKQLQASPDRRRVSASRSSMRNHNRSDLDDDDDEENNNNNNEEDDEYDNDDNHDYEEAKRRFRSDSAAFSTVSNSQGSKLARDVHNKSPSSMISTSDVHKTNEFGRSFLYHLYDLVSKYWKKMSNCYWINNITPFFIGITLI